MVVVGCLPQPLPRSPFLASPILVKTISLFSLYRSLWYKRAARSLSKFFLKHKDRSEIYLAILKYFFPKMVSFDIRHRSAPRNILDLFQDISNIHPYNTRSSATHNFYTQSSRLSIQLNSFSRIGTKIWNEMPLSLRNLSKHDFKRKIKRVLFNILSSEDSYLDIRNITQKVKFSSF